LYIVSDAGGMIIVGNETRYHRILDPYSGYGVDRPEFITCMKEFFGLFLVRKIHEHLGVLVRRPHARIFPPSGVFEGEQGIVEFIGGFGEQDFARDLVESYVFGGDGCALAMNGLAFENPIAQNGFVGDEGAELLFLINR
jgi:hypothetical protein